MSSSTDRKISIQFDDGLVEVDQDKCTYKGICDIISKKMPNCTFFSFAEKMPFPVVNLRYCDSDGVMITIEQEEDIETPFGYGEKELIITLRMTSE